MIRREVKGVNGKTIVELIPETAEDIAELERMADEQEIDDRHSFADDPAAWDTDPPKKPQAKYQLPRTTSGAIL